jgi:hypothetical protein
MDPYGAQWTGDFPETVRTHAFQWCEHVGDTTSRTVRMFENDALDSGPNRVWMFGHVVQ